MTNRLLSNFLAFIAILVKSPASGRLHRRRGRDRVGLRGGEASIHSAPRPQHLSRQ